MHRTALNSLVVVAAFAGLLRIANAQDFRVLNRTYFGAETPSESVTVFKAGLVYDFLDSPPETTIYDVPRRRFICLDPNRKVKTEIKVDDVEHHLARLKRLVDRSPKPFARFLRDPSFQASWSNADNEVELTSDWMIYRLKLVEPPNTNYFAQYDDFTDAICKFNAMKPNVSPPFGRLEVNRILREKGRIPSEVELVLFPEELKHRRITARTTHRIRWSLLEEDERRVLETANQITTFRDVTLTEYLGSELEAAAR